MRLLILLLTIACVGAFEYRVGDILMQSSPHNAVVDMIEGVTESPYSHCGLVARGRHGTLVVLEAVGPVIRTDLKVFLSRGRKGQHTVYRLSAAADQKHIPAMIAWAERQLGKPYDIRFRMDDEKLYCSELVWKAFKAASGEELGKPTALKDLRWKPYKRLIQKLEGSRTIPLERLIICPRDVAASKRLEAVHSTYGESEDKKP